MTRRQSADWHGSDGHSPTLWLTQNLPRWWLSGELSSWMSFFHSCRKKHRKNIVRIIIIKKLNYSFFSHFDISIQKKDWMKKQSNVHEKTSTGKQPKLITIDLSHVFLTNDESLHSSSSVTSQWEARPGYISDISFITLAATNLTWCWVISCGDRPHGFTLNLFRSVATGFSMVWSRDSGKGSEKVFEIKIKFKRFQRRKTQRTVWNNYITFFYKNLKSWCRQTHWRHTGK